MGIASAIVWVALVAAAAPTVDSPGRGETEISTEDLYELAVQALKDEHYDVAADLFKEIYLRTGDPWFIYNQAQALRLAGDCAAAVPLYRKFLAEPRLTERDRFDASQNIERCGEAVVSSGPPGESRSVAEPPVASASPPPPRVPPPPAEATALPTTPAKRVSPWLYDPVGWALVGTGAMSAVAIGVPLYVLGSRPPLPDLTETEYVEDVARNRELQTAATVLMAVGSGIILGGIARWIVVGRRHRRSRSPRSPTR